MTQPSFDKNTLKLYNPFWQRTKKDQTAGEAGDVAQLAEYLPSTHKALGFTPAMHTTGYGCLLLSWPALG